MPAKKVAARRSKKIIEPEIMPDEDLYSDPVQVEEDDDDPIVEQEHIVKNRYIKHVPLSEINTPEEDEERAEAEAIKRKPSGMMTEREDIKKKLAAHGIGNADQLKLRIDKLPSFDSDGLIGIQATDKAFIDHISCTIDYITEGKHIITARRYGGGHYWFTLRHGNTILKNWRERVIVPEAPVITTDPITGQPNITFQMPQQNGAMPAEPIKVPTLKESLKDMVEQKRYLKELMDDGQPQQQAQAPIAAFDANAINAEILKTKAFAEGIASIINPDKGSHGKKSALEILLEHAPEAASAIGTHIIAPLVEAFQRGRRNAQEERPPRQITRAQSQAQPENSPGSEGAVKGEVSQGDIEQSPIEDQVLVFLLKECQQRTPVSVTYSRLCAMADQIEDNAPAQSITGYFEMFAGASPEMVILWLENQVAGAKEILALPHGKQWVANLQSAVKKGMIDDENAE